MMDNDEVITAMRNLADQMRVVGEMMERVANNIHVDNYQNDKRSDNGVMIELWKHAAELRGAADIVNDWVNAIG